MTWESIFPLRFILSQAQALYFNSQRNLWGSLPSQLPQLRMYHSAYICPWICACTSTHMQTHKHKYDHMHTYHRVHMCTYECSWIYMLVHNMNIHWCLCIYMNTHECMYTYTHVYLTPHQFQLIPQMLSWNIFQLGKSSMMSHKNRFSFSFMS